MKNLLIFITAALMSMIFAASGTAQSSNSRTEGSTEGSVNITLTIGEKIIPAVLYNTPPARDLMERLPLTVSLNRGPVDYCGGTEPIAHTGKDLQAGYHSGDLAYWIPGQDFVIFVEDKKDASGSADLVILGKVNTDIGEIRKLGRTINVSITLDR